MRAAASEIFPSRMFRNRRDCALAIARNQEDFDRNHLGTQPLRKSSLGQDG